MHLSIHPFLSGSRSCRQHAQQIKRLLGGWWPFPEQVGSFPPICNCPRYSALHPTRYLHRDAPRTTRTTSSGSVWRSRGSFWVPAILTTFGSLSPQSYSFLLSPAGDLWRLQHLNPIFPQHRNVRRPRDTTTGLLQVHNVNVDQMDQLPALDHTSHLHTEYIKRPKEHITEYNINHTKL